MEFPFRNMIFPFLKKQRKNLRDNNSRSFISIRWVLNISLPQSAPTNMYSLHNIDERWINTQQGKKLVTAFYLAREITLINRRIYNYKDWNEITRSLSKPQFNFLHVFKIFFMIRYFTKQAFDEPTTPTFSPKNDSKL